jgi:uncharacterized protein YukE
MSMNDTFREMRNFHQELARFNDGLRGTMTELQSRQDRVSPIWQDDMRQEYDLQWRELDEMMKHYLSKESIGYSQFLDRKLQSLARYLGYR